MTTNKHPVIAEHKVVTMQYALSNDAGVTIRDAGEPAIHYLHGHGALFSRLESILEGHTVGDVVRARLLPDDAFGQRDLDLVQQVPLSAIPDNEVIEVGGTLNGTDEEGKVVPFTIKAVSEGMVHLDGNHPLAGQTLVFEMEIQAIRDATPEELETGVTGNPRD